MRRLTSDEIRRAYLDFFESKGHQVVPASSLVPSNDPTLLFTNAGMVQFKDVFLGLDRRPYTRATTSQKCMRISGKHNDLENVGPSPSHHTFFEMLGNFSFGDYFKDEAITFAYELLTKVFELPADRLAFTVYQDDDEAYNIWVSSIMVDPRRVVCLGPKTNFWQMAETGPCGPTTEIFWDRRPEEGIDSIADSLLSDDGRLLEIWNLVFMQYNRTHPDPQHTGKHDIPLPKPGVDTGMGLERMVAVIQDKNSTYDTDVFEDIMDAAQEILGHSNEFRQQNYVSYRVIADHIRAATFLISDKVNPGTNGRDYICRMLLRRAMRFAYGMGVNAPFLHKVAPTVIQKLHSVYPELEQERTAIQYYIAAEEERFLAMLERSLSILDNMITDLKTNGESSLGGSDAFFLFETHGLPLEITRDILKEQNLSIDEAGFRLAQDQHALQSRGETATIEVKPVYQDTFSDLQSRQALSSPHYNPYDYERLTVRTSIAALICNGVRVTQVSKGDQVEIVLEQTPFYVESGGQVSDTGTIVGDSCDIQVDNVHQPVGGLIIHVGRVLSGSLSEGATVSASVDIGRRWNIMRNHTATHLLHAALRKNLGTHVQQRGSLVAPEKLRFDFSHNSALTQTEIDQISLDVTRMILANVPVAVSNKPLDEARREGAMALFGEKYGSIVRTVTIPGPSMDGEYFSYELCGGTHIRHTGEIGTFLITAQGSSSAGVRRLEAVTGIEAYLALQGQARLLHQFAEKLGAPTIEAAGERISLLLQEVQDGRKSLEQMQRQHARTNLDLLIEKAIDVDGIKVLAAVIEASEVKLLSEIADWCRDRLQSSVVVLGSSIEGEARLVAALTKDVADRGVHAGNIIKSIAKIIDGKGGGRPDFATAGGKNPARLAESIELVQSLVAESLR